MDGRKLIRLGNSSYAISLPINWVKKAGLDKGDKLALVENSNGELIVSPEFKEGGEGVRREVEINVKGKDIEDIRRRFITAYINGKNIFTFIKVAGKRRRDLRKMIEDFISCEVYEEKENELVIKDLFDLNEIKIENFIKRAANNLREMMDIIILSIENGFSNSDLEEINKADSDINQIYFLTTRIMNIGLNDPTVLHALDANPHSLLNNWWFTYNIEHVGDNVKGIEKNIKSKGKRKNLSEILEIIKRTRELYENVLEAFYNNDKEKAYTAGNMGREILDRCNKLKEKGDSFLSLIGEQVRQVEVGLYQIIKIILNTNIDEDEE